MLGDFRIIKLDGLFHVVFRPDSDPEWLRIVASFFTYERAWRYCDVERCMTHDMDSETLDEEKVGLRLPPIQIDVEAMSDAAGLPEMIRDIYAERAPEPLPLDEGEHPEHDGDDDETPEEYHARQYRQAIAKQADRPTCAKCGGPRSASSGTMCRACYEGLEPSNYEITLTEKQEQVFRFFATHANAQKLVNASLKQIADESGIPPGSMPAMIETLERKRLIEVVERGNPTRSGVFRVVANEALLS